MKASEAVVLMFDNLCLLEIPLIFGSLSNAVFFQSFTTKQKYVL